MPFLVLILFYSLLTVHLCFTITPAVRNHHVDAHSSTMSLFDTNKADAKCTTCPLSPVCSGEYITRGCDGTGKIQGGIATWPLFRWWFIKVYRPCPAYLEAGFKYKREGQTLEQVLFSEPSNKFKEQQKALRLQQMEPTATPVPTPVPPSQPSKEDMNDSQKDRSSSSN